MGTLSGAAASVTALIKQYGQLAKILFADGSTTSCYVVYGSVSDDEIYKGVQADITVDTRVIYCSPKKSPEVGAYVQISKNKYKITAFKTYQATDEALGYKIYIRA